MAKQSDDVMDLIEKLKKQNAALEGEIARLLSPPHSLKTVLKVIGRMQEKAVKDEEGNEVPNPECVLVTGDQIVALPPSISAKSLKPGQMVTVNMANAVTGKVDLPLAGGTATVKRLFDGDMMEVAVGEGSGVGLIFKGSIADCVKVGDNVQLDRTGSVALRVMPKDKSAHSLEISTGVTWADIGGQDFAISVLRECIESPLKQKDLYAAYGKKPAKGVLLSGPPGCGKSMLAKAVATSVQEMFGGTGEGNFIYIKGPEVLNMWVGNTEAQIRSLFQRAKEHKLEYGYPAVIFIDEADAILGKRGGHHASVLSSTIVPTFLAEMDGLDDSGAFVLLATNRQDVLDPAIVREGRIDRKVRINRPALRESAQILSIHLRKTKTAEDPSELAGLTAAELFDHTHLLYRVGLKGKGVKPFHLHNLLSGAMLAGVVDVATSLAIARDAATGGKASGLTGADMTEAVAQVVKANRGLNHDDDLKLFAESEGAEIEALQAVAA